MADHRCVVFAERIEHPDDVTDQVKQRICLDGFRPIGLTIPTLVGRDRAKARVGESSQLMAPRVPGFGQSVRGA